MPRKSCYQSAVWRRQCVGTGSLAAESGQQFSRRAHLARGATIHGSECPGRPARARPAKLASAAGGSWRIENTACEPDAAGNSLIGPAGYRVESAEAELRAANADIGTAPALLFPSLTLGTDTSVAAGFGNPAASAVPLAANVLAPIFTGGKLTGNLRTVRSLSRKHRLKPLFNCARLKEHSRRRPPLRAIASGLRPAEVIIY
jgi:hypothetical protein